MSWREFAGSFFGVVFFSTLGEVAVVFCADVFSVFPFVGDVVGFGFGDAMGFGAVEEFGVGGSWEVDGDAGEVLGEVGGEDGVAVGPRAGPVAAEGG